jgi:hypothetical protein
MNRVTRRVFENIVQNVANPFFGQNELKTFAVKIIA